MTTVLERLLNYVKYDTKSDDNSTTVPSTVTQIGFAEVLKKELINLGLSNISLDENGYLFAELPSNTDKTVKTIGFIAHMDTAPSFSGENVNPSIIENYNGEDIILNEEKHIVMKVKDFPELSDYVGQTLVTTDGTTLLGADDKAGIAEILTAIEHLINHPEIEHGKIMVGFTPDEEVGRGADFFNVKAFNADFAYTVDGGQIGELEYENFNAAGAKVKINGTNVHPGYAKDKMVNSILIANELISSFPSNEVPEKTSHYEGFYHLDEINGSVETTTLDYIIRDFDDESFKNRKEFFETKIAELNEKYGENTLILELKDQYSNMKEKIKPHYHIVETANEAMKAVGVTPIIVPIRGGTDGSRLSFMGLPTPNLFTGGHNFHGKFEFIPVESMEKSVKVILKIIELYTNK